MITSTLKHQLLVAMPNMPDPAFDRAVIYILEHGEDGTMGLMINRPVAISLNDILNDMDIEMEVPPSDQHRVVSGGPVQQETGFIIHPADSHWHSSIPLPNDLMLTTSRDILEAIAVGEGPASSLICLGYAGWDAQQLEQELVDNSWLVTPATRNLMLNTDFDLSWHNAAAQIGVDISLIATQAGHG